MRVNDRISLEIPTSWKSLEGDAAEQLATSAEAMGDNLKADGVTGTELLFMLFPSLHLPRPTAKISLTLVHGGGWPQEKVRAMTPAEVASNDLPARKALQQGLPNYVRITAWTPLSLREQNGVVVFASGYTTEDTKAHAREVTQTRTLVITDRGWTLLCGYDESVQAIYAPICAKVLNSLTLLPGVK